MMFLQFLELMEEFLPSLYFDLDFVANLVELFEEIDTNGNLRVEWDV
jgi:hypothetical protein